MSAEYPVTIGGALAGHRILRGTAWSARPVGGDEVPARDGKHALDIIVGRACVPARSAKRRARTLAERLQGREPVSALAEPLRLVICGGPRTKNTGKRTASGKIIPPAPYRRWLKSALAQAMVERARLGFRGTIIAPVVVSCRFYLDADRTCDEDRLKVGIGDFLKAGDGAGFILDDDRKRLRWGDVTIGIDRRRPRVEIDIAVASAATGSGSSSSPARSRENDGSHMRSGRTNIDENGGHRRRER